eukprot:949869_1
MNSFIYISYFIVWIPLCLETYSSLSLWAGARFTCALGPTTNDSNTIKCWGDGGRGQLGYENILNIGDAPNQMGQNLLSVNLGSNFTPISLGIGGSHVCAQSDTHKLKCWGYNLYGTLGYGHKTNIGDESNEMGDNLATVNLGTNFDVMEVTAGAVHTYALSTDRKVKCFGYNAYGQLGQGDTNDRGDEAGEMGDNLLEVDLGTNFTVTQISARGAHSCALSTTGRVKCWGWNVYGELGQGDTNNRGDGPNEMGDNLLPIDLGTNFVASYIEVGYSHVCALSASRTAIKCFGENTEGELGQGDTNHRGDVAGEMGDNLLPIDLGSDFDGTPIQILTGNYYSCAVAGSKIKCFGRNNHGQSAQGDSPLKRGDEANEMGNNLPIIDLGTGFEPIDIACGGYHICTADATNNVKCWGWNKYGQLGQGNIINVGDVPNQMGDKIISRSRSPC